MKRSDIFDAISNERTYQDAKWGTDFDSKNTPNDWITYMIKYLGKAVTMPMDNAVFKTNLLKAITIGVATLEQDNYAPRHYD